MDCQGIQSPMVVLRELVIQFNINWVHGCRIQILVGYWLVDIVMWRYNTHRHHTWSDVSYHLIIGQFTFGKSNLHIGPHLLKTLATETELNQLVGMPVSNKGILNVFQGQEGCGAGGSSQW